MRSLRALPILLAVVVACDSAGGSPAGGGDYYAQLERISQNAHIQSHGLARDLRRRIERATTPGERLDAVEVTIDQRVRLFEDVVDALEGLQPVEGIGPAHEAYAAAWRALLDLTQKVRDSEIRTVPEYLGTLRAKAFRDAERDVGRTCEGLQTIADAAERAVDLGCEDRLD